MEVDMSHSSTTASIIPMPTVDECSDTNTTLSLKERLLNIIDQVEARTETMRKDALKLEEEKDSILDSLDSITQSDWMHDLDEFERDDIQHSVGRVMSRCLTVEVMVRTNRDPHQEDALNQVNQYIDSLVMGVKEDPVNTKIRCQSYMNACSSHVPEEEQSTSSRLSCSDNFETAILGCTADDQKKIKKRLQGLLDYFARINITST